MSPHLDEPRVVVVAPQEQLPGELLDVLGDALIRPRASDADVLQLLRRHPSLRLLILVERAASDRTLDLLQLARAQDDQLAVLVLSAAPTIEHATEAIRRGAEDFVPVSLSTELLRKAVERALEAVTLRDDVRALRTLVSTTYGFDQIISNARRMRPVFERALAASRSDTPVLITGETGTGKELLARAIHANSRRRHRPFVPINCAALPRELVESELFGHRRGAFSGADRDHPGLLVAADRGSLLLDEIGELSGEVQAKLLRVLQDGEIRPVGGLESHRVDLRIIAATNRSAQELRGGAMRQDLFFRLSVLVIELPPLRQRLEDLPRLIQHFLARYRNCGASGLCRIDDQALELLTQYPFPGNVRELENLVHSFCSTFPPDRATIEAEDVRAWLRRQGASWPADSRAAQAPTNLRELETWAIRTALAQAHGNKTRAAALLGISRDTLYRKLLEFRPRGIRLVKVSDRRWGLK